MTTPTMFYFGPWDMAGHFMWTEWGGRPQVLSRHDLNF